MVRACGLQIGYRVRRKKSVVMSNLSVTARRGELVAVIGRNGTGKSTLLRTITGLLPALGGTVTIDGLTLRETGHTRLPRMVSFVSTEPLMVRNIRVRDVVALGRFPYTNWIGTLTGDDEMAVKAAMEATGVAGLAERTIDSISDGERQRTLIARSLAQDTGLMTMDEPTAFLDLPSRYSIVSLLRHLTREKGKCVIYSTHDLDTAISEADKIWLMTGGTVYEGAPEDLLLKDVMTQAFGTASLTFSRSEGTFRLLRPAGPAVTLEGEGVTGRLTARALARCGFKIDDRAGITVRIAEEGEQITWMVEKTGKQEERYTSLYDLAAALQRYYLSAANIH